ncbi:MAG: dihydropteroate synthase [Pseudomonadota bacterium]
MRVACADRIADCAQPLIMGVLNVTPDSFSDGGRLFSEAGLDVEQAVGSAQAMVDAGADIIDIGGESTRPGAQPVSIEQEIQRVIPVLRQVRKLDTIVSVDTRHAEVARAAIAEGAHIINDVGGGRDAGMLQAIGAADVGYVIMHMLGEPATMQRAPSYDDVVGDVSAFLTERMLAAMDAGVDTQRLMVDPGFGFGKDLSHNLELLRGLPQMLALQVPLVVGLSRKRMIEALTGAPLERRLAGSLALALKAVDLGAHIVRVHDVQATHDALRIWQAVG